MYIYIPILLFFVISQAVAQDSLVEWVKKYGLHTTPVHRSGTQVGRAQLQARDMHGNLTLYASRQEFDAQFPTDGQTCEDFEANNFGDGSIIGFPAPLDETTDNSVFSTGSIIPDLTIQDNPLNDSGGGSVNGLVAVGATAFGTPSDIVLANTFIDSLDLLIDGNYMALAFDVFSFTAGGTATVSFFDASDTLLGSTDVAAGPATSGFVGVESPAAIARVNISSVDGTGADEAEGADNICLAGGVPVVPVAPQSIPSLQVWGLLLLSTLLGWVGWQRQRRARA